MTDEKCCNNVGNNFGVVFMCIYPLRIREEIVQQEHLGFKVNKSQVTIMTKTKANEQMKPRNHLGISFVRGAVFLILGREVNRVFRIQAFLKPPKIQYFS